MRLKSENTCNPNGVPQEEKAQRGHSSGTQGHSADGRPGSVSRETSAFLPLPGLRASPGGVRAGAGSAPSFTENPSSYHGPAWRTRTELGVRGPSENCFLKNQGENRKRTISSHRCNCKDIKLDPSRISDPAIMGLLLGEAIVPSFSSALGLPKIPKTVRKFT